MKRQQPISAGPDLEAQTVVVNKGAPLELDMSLIDEDPYQPRTNDNPGFAHDSLAELAASIHLRGVKTPISVRENPGVSGRYIINHGARRFRGSLMAQKLTIPGFIDNNYIDDDQVIENLHRDGLTAREIADYIGRKLAKGMKKGAIARAISKSPAFVTQHVTLLDLPDPIATAFNLGRTKDVTVVNELVTAYKKNPHEVTDWLADETQEITRGAVKLFREFLDDKHSSVEDDEEVFIAIVGLSEVEQMHTPIRNDDELSVTVTTGSGEGAHTFSNNEGYNKVNHKKLEQPEKAVVVGPNIMTKAIVHVQYEGRLARLMLERRPPASGWAWLKYEQGGEEFKAALSSVQLTEILEGSL
ncbi:ParB/RepB/Spo0J family partition protein [Methylobacter psychrophilus]|nr:ParB/RepB/Spo0J family partition protein [Methylobacter psychrophilus]